MACAFLRKPGKIPSWMQGVFTEGMKGLDGHSVAVFGGRTGAMTGIFSEVISLVEGPVLIKMKVIGDLPLGRL